LSLDTPHEKSGVSKRQQLEKVYEQSGVLPPELADEVKPEFWDEPLFNMFFEMFQRGQEFYQSVYYYQQIMGFEFDGEDLTVLNILWNAANTYLSDKDKKKSSQSDKTKDRPSSKHAGRKHRR